MQQLKENLTLEVNATLVTHLSLQRHNSDIAAILENITASLSELRRADGNFTLTVQESNITSNITSFSQMLNQTNVTVTQDPEITEVCSCIMNGHCGNAIYSSIHKLLFNMHVF